MMGVRPFGWLVCLTILIVWLATLGSAMAGDSCRISVVTILAARDGATIDPKLQSTIGELQSLFTFTSYRLLSGEHVTLEKNKSGSVSLPGDHELDITLDEIRGDRASLVMNLSRQHEAIFASRIQILNRGSLFVGGPSYLNGNLIFQISSAF